jgi:formylglycine-generating enzyme required for sulfatase activity
VGAGPGRGAKIKTPVPGRVRFEVLRGQEEVAAWLGLGLTGPAMPAAPPVRREPPSRVPPEPDECVEAAGVLIGRFPVTNAAFARFRPDHPRVGDPQLADHPVVLVTRADAAAFCAWLGGRLPTSAEWTAAAGPHTWPWGETFDPERCNCAEAGWGWTTPVRAHPEGASPCGAEDLAGNVWEWVSDTRADGWGVLRGGCHLDTAHGVAGVRELPADPARATPTTGFRIVVERREAWIERS